MTKKTKPKKKRVAQQNEALQDLLRASQMMQFVREPNQGRELTTVLQNLDQELENAYRIVRELACGDPNEEKALQAVRDMENHRFVLLGEMHGNQIQAYLKI